MSNLVTNLRENREEPPLTPVVTVNKRLEMPPLPQLRETNDIRPTTAGAAIVADDGSKKAEGDRSQADLSMKKSSTPAPTQDGLRSVAPEIMANEVWAVVSKQIKWSYEVVPVSSQCHFGGVAWFTIPPAGGKGPKDGGIRGVTYLAGTFEEQRWAVENTNWKGDEAYHLNFQRHEAKLKLDRNGGRRTRHSVATLLDSENAARKPLTAIVTDLTSPGDAKTQEPLVTPDANACRVTVAKKKNTKRKRNDEESVRSKASVKRKQDLVVQEWMRKAIPDCHSDDVTQYADTMVKMGFGTVDMISNFLSEDDLDFMPRAYKRAVWLAKPLPEEDNKHQTTQKWIDAFLPDLDVHDKTVYSTCLVEQGFYSDAMLDLIDESDLNFMRPAHLKLFALHHNNKGCCKKKHR